MNTDCYIFKIKYGDVLRRITVGPACCSTYGFIEYIEEPNLTFGKLEKTIREAFKLPATSELVIVYTDKDNDEVTMVDDGDIRDACTFQKLNPVRVTVRTQESQRPAHDGRPPESLAVDPPPWAADIILKLDQLLLAVNKQLVDPGVESVSTISTKIEHPVLEGVDVSPIDGGPTIEHAKDIEEWRFETAQSGDDPEFQRRAMILRQRMIADEFSD